MRTYWKVLFTSNGAFSEMSGCFEMFDAFLIKRDNNETYDKTAKTFFTLHCFSLHNDALLSSLVNFFHKYCIFDFVTSKPFVFQLF